VRAALAAVVLLSACVRDDRVVTVAAAILPAELPVYRAVVADFERATATRVVVVPQQYADLRRALVAEATAGVGTIDLVELDVYALAPAAPHVVPLDPADVGVDLARFDAEAIRAGTIDGGLRFLPQRLGWEAMIYDSAAIPVPPDDWDALLAVARAHPGAIAFKGALYEGLTCDVLSFVCAAGGSGEVLDDAGALAAFRLFAALAPYLHPGSATFKEPDVAEAMARGEVVLQFNWPAIMSVYEGQGLAPGRIRSAPLPRGPAGRATVLGGGYLAVPTSAPHRERALALARHLLGADAQRTFAERLGWFSARRDVPGPSPDGPLAGFAAMRAAVRPRPARADYSALSRRWQDAFRRVAFAHEAPEAALRAAAAR
jgi:ABC-type glycerol-3-phosphate transport system substrate-binding protein